FASYFLLLPFSFPSYTSWGYISLKKKDHTRRHNLLSLTSIVYLSHNRIFFSCNLFFNLFQSNVIIIKIYFDFMIIYIYFYIINIIYFINVFLYITYTATKIQSFNI